MLLRSQTWILLASHYVQKAVLSEAHLFDNCPKVGQLLQVLMSRRCCICMDSMQPPDLASRSITPTSLQLAPLDIVAMAIHTATVQETKQDIQKGAATRLSVPAAIAHLQARCQAH
jgi:hypothetical protein